MSPRKKAPVYGRVLLKLSGEALAGDRAFGFDFDKVGQFADEVAEVVRLGCEVGLVIGGGNIVRGSQLATMGMDRVACAAASVAGVPAATMTSTGGATSSFARVRNRSARPSA